MKILQKMGLFACLISGAAHALIPETGLWGGLGEPGRGLSIELQDDNMCHLLWVST